MVKFCDPVEEEEEVEEEGSHVTRNSRRSPLLPGAARPRNARQSVVSLRAGGRRLSRGAQPQTHHCRGQEGQRGGPAPRWLVQPRDGLRPQRLVRLQPLQRRQLHRVRRAVSKATKVGQGEQLQPVCRAGDGGGRLPQGLGQARQEPVLGDLPPVHLRVERGADAEEGELQARLQVK